MPGPTSPEQRKPNEVGGLSKLPKSQQDVIKKLYGDLSPKELNEIPESMNKTAPKPSSSPQNPPGGTKAGDR